MAAAVVRDRLNVMVFGDSFVRRLRDWAFSNRHLNLNLDESRLSVYWHGLGGGVITPLEAHKSLWPDRHLIHDLESDILVLQVGSNDLSRSSIQATDLQASLSSFIVQCFQDGVKFVVFCEILERRNCPNYNVEVQVANEAIELAFHDNPRVHFWKHSRNNFNTRFTSDYVADDGVHVDTQRGMPRYYTSIRGAVILAENVVRNK